MTADTHVYLTPPEVAKALRVSQGKVALWIKSGRLRAFNVSEGQRPKYRIRPDDLDEFLQARAVTPAERQAPVRRRRDIPQYV